MRKFLFLVLFAFLWSDLALAEKSCKNKMDVKRELDPPIVLFSFKSSCEHNFYVKTFNVKTSDGRIIKEENSQAAKLKFLIITSAVLKLFYTKILDFL